MRSFDVHFAGDGLDLGAALVAEALLHVQQLVLDDLQHPGVVGEDVLPILDLCLQAGQLFLDLEDLETSQTAQLQFHDRVGLRVVEAELLHDRGLCLGHAALAGADGGDELIHDVGGLLQTLEDVGALLGLLQIILRAAADDFILELDVLLYHLFQGHDLRHLVSMASMMTPTVSCSWVYWYSWFRMTCALASLRMSTTMRIPCGWSHRSAGDALDPLVLDQLCHVLDETGLVDHIRNFRDDDLGTAILGLFDGSTAPQSNFAAAGGVGGADAASAHDDAGSGKVRSLDVLHQAGQVDVRVLDIATQPSMTSLRLWGGMLVAIPTAMP